MLYFAYTTMIEPNRLKELAPGSDFLFVAHLPETVEAQGPSRTHHGPYLAHRRLGAGRDTDCDAPMNHAPKPRLPYQQLLRRAGT